MNKFLSVLFVLNILFVHGQDPTIGLVKYTDSVSSGYTLFSPEANFNVYLIDNCGNLVNEWVFNEYPAITSYILDNGNLLYAGKDSITIRDWNNNTLWSYATTANGIRQHHDIEPLPNGNILCIANEIKTTTEQTTEGKDPSLLGGNFKVDYIIELEPVGSNGANVVWEWHFWDHLIQDYSASENNFGVVGDHPELMDVNYFHGNYNDWTHLNGIDYNANRDQIIISSRTINELYIIDHSTTIIESAGHSGGLSGKGGDFLWRWGNPKVYDQGTDFDQQLFGQHNGEWVHDNYLNEGKISVFNNGGDGTSTFSSVHLIDPEIIGVDYQLINNTFSPSSFFYTWNGNSITEVLNATKKSGVQFLPEGGFLICDTDEGKFIELNNDESIVWTYINPHGTGAVNNQFEIFSGENSVFRAEKYPLDHPGILANSIVIGGIIENENSLSLNCTDVSGNQELFANSFEVINPITTSFMSLSRPISCNYTILNINGTVKAKGELHNSESFFIGNIEDGVYLVRFQRDNDFTIKRVVVLN